MSPSGPAKKSALDKLIYVVIGLSIFVVASGLVIINFWDELGVDKFFGSGELPPVNFELLTVSQNQNHYLACPTGYCPEAEPDEISPIFLISAMRLRNRLIKISDADNRIDLKEMDLKNLQFDFLVYMPQRTYPDVVTAKIYNLGPNESTIAIYSRTLKGQDDTNANRARVKRWLRHLEGQ